MYENFAFTHLENIDPTSIYVLCNEISDHQPFYMWGRVARRYLMLPAEGYHIATSVHADTVDDVIHLYQHELRLTSEAVRRLGLIVNIGLVGEGVSSLRRWLTVHFLQPEVDPENPHAIVAIPLSLWNQLDDTFEHVYQRNLWKLAKWVNLTTEAFISSLKNRIERLQELAQGDGIGMDQMYDAISKLREQEYREVNLTMIS
jgi:hypothetical protein